MDDLTTRTIPVGDLTTYHRNPRRGDVEVIADSLRHLGQYRPIVVNQGTRTGRPLEVLAGNHCVDEQTEALTRRGWVNGWDLTTDDTILTVDRDGQLRWSPVHDIFRNPNYHGPMHRLCGSIDALVSPGHKFMLTDGTLVPVDQLGWHQSIRITGAALDSVAAIYTDQFVELVGWAVTEGHFRVGEERTHPYRKPATRWVRISQKPGPKADRINICLKRCGARYRTGKSGRQGRVLTFDVAGEVANELHRVAPGRVLSMEFLLALSAEQRALLIETMLDGDGHRTPTQCWYTQRDPAHMDAFIALCAMSGYVTYTRTRTPPTTTGEYRNSKPYLVTSIRMRPRPVDTGSLRRNGNWTIEMYRGLLWCPTTDHGTWICRRGGRVHLTGNTLLAARELGWPTIQATVVDVDDDTAARIVLVDNRSSDLAGYDDGALAALLSDLPDLTATGYTDADLEALLEGLGDPGGGDLDGDPDDAPEPPADPVTRPGDLWLLGPHRLLCGDATNPAHLDRLTGDLVPSIVYTDPPYGINAVPKDGGASRGGPFGGIKAAGPIIPAQAYPAVVGDDNPDVARDAFRLLFATYPNARHVWWGGNHYAASVGLPDASCWLVWDKENGGSDFADAELAWTNHPGSVRLLRHMWNGMLRASEREKRVHPTQKPAALAQWAFGIVDPDDSRDTALDVFAGSGSTLLAAHATGRTALLMELESAYCDVICRRWQQATGERPRLDNGSEHDFANP